MRTRNSAAYKGVSSLLMLNNCEDFLSGKPIDEDIYFNERVDIHHIFPQKYCEGKISKDLCDSIINKTPLSARTNQIIGGSAPSIYLKNCRTSIIMVFPKSD